MAFSLNDYSGRYWETAERAAWQVLSHLLQEPPKQPILWNVNIPAVAPDDIQGCKITRLGRRHHVQSIVPARNPRGEAVYWIGPAGDVSDREEGTDFAECEAGFITITPLQIDLTGFDQMAQVAGFWQPLSEKFQLNR